MDENRWINKHHDYSQQNWITKPSIFAQQVTQYFPKSGRILELGSGHGQDGIYFAAQGFDVVSTDLEVTSLNKNVSNIKNITVSQLDLRDPLPYNAESFDIVYAHLSLHYFNKQTTKRIFEDIHKVLKPNGVLAFLVNSTDDPEYDTGGKIEENYFEIDGAQKRFFDTKSAESFAGKFSVIVADNKGETYKDAAKGVHNLIRFIGGKSNERIAFRK